jgi:hypothetical protein
MACTVTGFYISYSVHNNLTATVLTINQHMHTIVIRFRILFLKSLNSSLFRNFLLYHHIVTINVLPDERPIRSEICGSVMCLEYSCELNENCMQLLVKTVDITALVISLSSITCIAHGLLNEGT